MHRPGAEIGVGGPISRFLRLIRFSHTIFALPFALGELIVAANGWPTLRLFGLGVVRTVFARTWGRRPAGRGGDSWVGLPSAWCWRARQPCFLPDWLPVARSAQSAHG